MIAWRLLRVALHVLLGLLICSLVFPLVSAAGRRAQIQRWSARLLRIFRVNLEIVGDSTAVHAEGLPGVIVANHVSWLDIFVINAMQPCRFVAKSDIRDWPLLGYLCARSNTIFISRGSRRDVRATFKSLVSAISAGERVAFFPEGTTAAQGTLLPFHANLFQAPIEAAVPLQPLALRYLDPQGRLYSGVDYIGETTFLESMLVVLRGPAIRAQIVLLAPIASSSAEGNRRVLSLATHAAIATALGVADMADGESGYQPQLQPTDAAGA